jgi:DNA-binding transcriptional LysR family regulator
VLARFHREHPGVEISLLEDSSDHLIEQLLDGRIDLGLVGLAGPPPAGIAAHVVTDEAIVAAVGPGDPWWDRPTVTVDELRDRPLVCLPRGTGMRGVLDGALAAAGVSPRIAFESGDPGVVADLAARGLGVAIIPDTGARAHPDLHGVGFEPELRGFVALAWRAGGHTSPAGRALAEHARAALPAVTALPPVTA